MAIWQVLENGLQPLEETGLADEGVRERDDLQRLLRENIAVIAEDVLVIAEEYGGWTEGRRRIDLLGVDTEANLVIIDSRPQHGRLSHRSLGSRDHRLRMPGRAVPVLIRRASGRVSVSVSDELEHALWGSLRACHDLGCPRVRSVRWAATACVAGPPRRVVV